MMNPVSAPLHTVLVDQQSYITPQWAMYLQRRAPQLLSGSHADRLANYPARQFDDGSMFHEIDWDILYLKERVYVDQDSASGAAVLYVSDTTGFTAGDKVSIGHGTKRHEERVIDTVTAGVSLTLTANLSFDHDAADADRVTSPSGAGHYWRYVSGTYRDTLANIPAGLGLDHTGFLFHATNYLRTFRWTGSAWEYASGERLAKEIIWYPGTLPASGWALCDGGSVTVTLADATTTSFTTPDLTGQYLKGGVYTGSVETAVAPTLSGTIDDEDAHTHEVVHDHPAKTSTATGSTAVQSGAGSNVTPAGSTVSVDPDSITVTSGAGSAHTHGITGLSITDTAEPAHVLLLPIVKL